MALTDIDLAGVGTKTALVGAVFAGEDDCFMVLIPGKEDTTTPRPVALDTVEWKTFLRQTDLQEISIMVEDAETGKLKRALLRKCERQVGKHISWNVFRRDNFTCRYCGAKDKPLTVDHLVTWESGGPTTEENLVASCGKCNNTRGEMPYDEWLKDPYYQRVKKGLDYATRFANDALVPTLANIPRTPIKEPGKKRNRR